MNDVVETEEQTRNRLRYLGVRKALEVAAPVLGHIRSQIGGRFGDERGVDVRVESTPLRTGQVDDADAAFVTLIEWVEFWGEQFQNPYPQTVLHSWRNGNNIGFPAGTSQARAEMQVRLYSLWLLARLERIHEHPAGSEFEDDVIRIVFSLRAKYPTAPRPERLVHPRPCPECGEPGVRAWWRSGDVTDVEIRCEVCGYTIEATAAAVEGWLS